MTRKDYEMIAQAIRDSAPQSVITKDFEQGAKWALDEVANKLAGDLAADNPRFDIDRFLQACGVES